MSSFDYGDADPYGNYQQQAPTAYAPSAGAAPPSADITVAPGYTPDYGSLLQNDPSLVAAKNAADAAQQQADAARRAAVRSAYVQYGGSLPSDWSDKYGDLDQATQDAAKNNQFSTISNLHRNYAESVERFKRALGARGALQSGDWNWGEDQLNRNLGQGEYDAGNAFANQLTGLYGNYAGVLGQNARDLASAVGGAQSNVFNNPANRPVAPTVAHYDSSLSGKYGKPVYTDAWGTIYDQYGNVMQAGTPPPAPAPVAPAPSYTDASSGGGYEEPAPYVPQDSEATNPISDAPLVDVGALANNYVNNPIPTTDYGDPFAFITGKPVSGYSWSSGSNLH